MSLQRLANEMIEAIVDNISPESHLSFALTSKRHLACSRRILAHHKHCHDNYKALDDTSLPVYNQQGIFNDPVAAWHIREFIVYTDQDGGVNVALHLPALRLLEIHDVRKALSHFAPASPVREIHFRGSTSVNKRQIRSLMLRCTSLKTITFEDCTAGLVQTIIKEASISVFQATVQTIAYHKRSEFRELIDRRLFDIPAFLCFSALRHVAVNLRDLRGYALNHTMKFSEQPLTTALEIPFTQTISRIDVYGILCHTETEVVEEALAAIIRSMRAPCLEVVSLARVRRCPSNVDLERRRLHWSEEAIEEGHTMGVLVVAGYHNKETCSLFGARPFTKKDMEEHLRKINAPF